MQKTGNVLALKRGEHDVFAWLRNELSKAEALKCFVRALLLHDHEKKAKEQQTTNLFRPSTHTQQLMEH